MTDERVLEAVGRCLDGEPEASDEAVANAEGAEQMAALQDAEARLRAAFADDGGAAASLRFDALADTGRPGGAWRVWLPAAVAACLVIAGGVVFGPRLVGGGDAGLDGGALHAGYVADPEPTTVCDTGPKFEAYAREYFRRGIGADFAAASSAGVALVGWRPVDALPTQGVRSKLLMADGPGGEPVVVLFQSVEAEPLSAGGGLNVHEARFGHVAAYEVSVLEAPVVLPLLSDVQ